MSATHKKRIRLKNFEYKGSYRYFITLCAANKRRVFEDVIFINWLVEVLRENSRVAGFKVWAWCFMPDHLHLLVEGEGADSDVKRFISAYKQRTAFYYKKKTALPLWQINFYERVLRKEEDTVSVAWYIFNNPVRKNLVSDYRQYDSLGSFEFECRAGL